MRVEHAREIAAFQSQVDTLKSQPADMQHLVFGRSTEKKSTAARKQEKQTCSSSRPKGQQRWRKGHGRTTVTTLPVVSETLDLEESQKHCPACGLPFKAFGMEDFRNRPVAHQANANNKPNSLLSRKAASTNTWLDLFA
ncbi:hypothetical protein M3P05_02065 [Sansalvadorimonas sp. 2012CJ34-2]|uniref:Transposase n=1 Tax=Parendozoicomonas callyspongiae TaxID=2942213 RepID=A0ABT0PBH6_9GAMM|nr:hypothetical protein [Sansalvadorimonas sp. 2012CJ34-2]MCL6268734.1 hypothetical protein [Sansalvadorimonas sp. 2012CJ34-2]